jgi:hypothetical protein
VAELLFVCSKGTLRIEAWMLAPGIFALEVLFQMLVDCFVKSHIPGYDDQRAKRSPATPLIFDGRIGKKQRRLAAAVTEVKRNCISAPL